VAITAQSIIQRATDLLQDQTSVRWPVRELIRWFNDAQRAVVKVRPDAMNTTATVTLAAGTRQDLGNMSLTPPPVKLIDAARNMAGTSTKQAITLVDRKLFDTGTPNWHNETPSVNVVHYMFDPRDPKTFHVYPPATTAAQLEVMYSAYPTDIADVADGVTYTAVTGNLSLPDIYADDVLNLIMFRAFSKDSEGANDPSKAAAYLQMVTASLGAEVAATVTVGPK